MTCLQGEGIKTTNYTTSDVSLVGEREIITDRSDESFNSNSNNEF